MLRLAVVVSSVVVPCAAASALPPGLVLNEYNAVGSLK